MAGAVKHEARAFGTPQEAFFDIAIATRITGDLARERWAREVVARIVSGDVSTRYEREVRAYQAEQDAASGYTAYDAPGWSGRFEIGVFEKLLPAFLARRWMRRWFDYGHP